MDKRVKKRRGKLFHICLTCLVGVMTTEKGINDKKRFNWKLLLHIKISTLKCIDDILINDTGYYFLFLCS